MFDPEDDKCRILRAKRVNRARRKAALIRKWVLRSLLHAQRQVNVANDNKPTEKIN